MKIVSNDGKKVKRRIPFTEKDKEDLQVHIYISLYYSFVRFIFYGANILLSFFLLLATHSCC